MGSRLILTKEIVCFVNIWSYHSINCLFLYLRIIIYFNFINFGNSTFCIVAPSYNYLYFVIMRFIFFLLSTITATRYSMGMKRTSDYNIIEKYLVTKQQKCVSTLYLYYTSPWKCYRFLVSDLVVTVIKKISFSRYVCHLIVVFTYINAMESISILHGFLNCTRKIMFFRGIRQNSIILIDIYRPSFFI